MRDERGRHYHGSPWRHRWLDNRRRDGVAVWNSHLLRGVMLFNDGRVTWRHRFDPTATDCGPLEAYCRGDMPAHVFSDWVEENAPDFPAEGLAILRADLG